MPRSGGLAIANRYFLYGSVVESQLPLHALAVDAAPEIFLERGADSEQQPLNGRIIADTNWPGKGYLIVEADGGVIMRFRSLADFELTEHAITATLVPGTDPVIAGVLATGNVMAARMTLEERCVLHASAVAATNGCIALVGPPGRGKSTLAAILVGAGAQFVTDDVLAIDERADRLMCVPSGATLRLRAGAAWLGEVLKPDDDPVASPDGKTIVSVANVSDAAPLRAIIFPIPDHDLQHARIERLSPRETLMRLTTYPRLLGWVDPAILQSTFRWNAVLAKRIPSYSAVLPWGPPFDDRMLEDLLELAR